MPGAVNPAGSSLARDSFGTSVATSDASATKLAALEETRRQSMEFHRSCKILDQTSEQNSSVLRWSFCFLGVGYLFPYNTVITAVDYFQRIYGASIDFYLALMLIAPSLAVLAANFIPLVSNCINLRMSHSFRIAFSYSVFAVLIVILPLVSNRNVTYLCTIVIGTTTALVSLTLFDLIGFLGADLMSAFQTGLGVGGLVVGACRIVTKALFRGGNHQSDSSDDDETLKDLRYSTYLYFALALIIVVLNVVVYACVISPRIRDRIRHIAVVKAGDPMLSLSPRIVRIAQDKGGKDSEESNALLQSSTVITSVTDGNYGSTDHSNTSVQNKGQLKNAGEQNQTERECFTTESSSAESSGLCEVVLQVWPMIVAILLTCIVCIALFPGVVSLMTAPQWDSEGWFPVLQIFIFNMCDTLGKYSTMHQGLVDTWFGKEMPHTSLMVASCLRVLFVPLFILCVKYPSLFQWWLSVLLNVLFGFTQGFFVTSSMNLGRSKVSVEQTGFVMQIMVFVLTLGLTLGGLLSFPLLWLIRLL